MIKLYKIINEKKPHILQCWMYHANLIGCLYKIRFPQIIYLWGIHNNDLNRKRNRLSTVIVAKVSSILSYFLVDKIVYCSHSARRFHEHIGYNKRRGIVIENGTDTSFFDEYYGARIDFRKQWNIKNETFVIGMVARWDKQKNHISLIQAFSNVRKKNNKIALLLCGQNINLKNVELVELLKNYNVENDVLLVGESLEVNKVYNGIDLHVLPSFGEAFGNVTIEAMACKIPCIMSNVGAGNEIIGNTGWILKNTTADKITEAILDAIEVANNSSSWSALRESCRNRVISEFSLGAMKKKYFKLWDLNNE